MTRSATILAALALAITLDARPAAAFGCADQVRLLSDSQSMSLLGGGGGGGTSLAAPALDRDFQAALSSAGRPPAEEALAAALARAEDGDEAGCQALLNEARRLMGR